MEIRETIPGKKRGGGSAKTGSWKKLGFRRTEISEKKDIEYPELDLGPKKHPGRTKTRRRKNFKVPVSVGGGRQPKKGVKKKRQHQDLEMIKL